MLTNDDGDRQPTLESMTPQQDQAAADEYEHVSFDPEKFKA